MMIILKVHFYDKLIFCLLNIVMVSSCQMKFFHTLNMYVCKKLWEGFLFLEWICYCVL
jgi:hypothetical protein